MASTLAVVMKIQSILIRPKLHKLVLFSLMIYNICKHLIACAVVPVLLLNVPPLLHVLKKLTADQEWIYDWDDRGPSTNGHMCYWVWASTSAGVLLSAFALLQPLPTLFIRFVGFARCTLVSDPKIAQSRRDRSGTSARSTASSE